MIHSPARPMLSDTEWADLAIEERNALIDEASGYDFDLFDHATISKGQMDSEELVDIFSTWYVNARNRAARRNSAEQVD